MPDDAPSAPKATAPRTAPKYETETKERIRAAIRKYQKSLADLVARDANEGDTRLFVTEIICEALGFDRLNDLATEYMVRGEFADYGLRIDQQLVAFVECKRATTKLGVKHLRQVEMYALNEGVSWVILTNGAEWHVYHITAAQPVAVDLAFTVNLLGPETAAHKAGILFHISKEGLRKHTIDEVWKARSATSAKSLARAILSEPVLVAIRKEVRRATGHNCDEAELAGLLKETVIRPDALV